MTFSPEIGEIPGIAVKFIRSGLARELITGLVNDNTPRKITEDAWRIKTEFDREVSVELSGVENVAVNVGGLIFFNHPNIDVLMPALATLIIQLSEKGHIPMLLMASEIPLFGKLNHKKPMPGSGALLGRLHKMYSDNIISVPTATSRKDYFPGRVRAVRKMITALQKGNVVMISPEGHTEVGNRISPLETFHSGPGGLAKMAVKIGVASIPVAIWREEKSFHIKVKVGEPVPVKAQTSDDLVVREIMQGISRMLPEELRGSFQYDK